VSKCSKKVEPTAIISSDRLKNASVLELDRIFGSELSLEALVDGHVMFVNELGQAVAWARGNDVLLVVKDGLVLETIGTNFGCIKKTSTAVVSNMEGVVLPRQVGSKQCLMNADVDYSLAGYHGAPSISFNCAARFFTHKPSRRASSTDVQPSERLSLAKLFVDGILKVSDFHPDEIRELSASEKKSKNPAPPQTGFTRVRNSWHRPATVLVNDTRKGGRSYLFGQDEGTYFGVELLHKVTTVDAAFKDLVPKKAQGRSDALRQGEWFAVPVLTSEVPTRLDLAGTILNSYVVLPFGSDSDNEHRLYAPEARLAKTGQLFACEFDIDHGEHSRLSGKSKTWYTFYRNTAVRSFSESGVD
jgi:hypothetical protein